MNKILTLLAFFPFALSAQTMWPVNVGGSTIGATLPYYSPTSVTISVGDIVRWSNQSGTHNVNGTTTLFPSNPMSFNSGNAANGPWTYQFTFTIPGVYNYHCTQEGHAATQTGQIIVNNNVGVAELEAAYGVSVFPVPASTTLVIASETRALRSASIIGLDGQQVLSATINAATRTEVDITSLAAGNYFVLITDTDGRVMSKPFSKQ